MSKTVESAVVAGHDRTGDTPTADEVRAQLSQILSSPLFHGSKRCQHFLQYACEKALSGESGALKERCIAIEVFGRRPDLAGNSDDTIVRVGAREVRKRLAQYYVTPGGSASHVTIDLAPGAYVPEFRYALPRIAAADVAPTPVRPAIQPPAKTWRILAGAAGVLAFSLTGFVLARTHAAEPAATQFQRFWGPVLQASQPLLIGIGHPIVYLPSHRALVLNELLLPPSRLQMQRKIELRPDEIDGSDMVPALNQFVGFGDMMAANEVTQMLARHGRGVRVMMSNSVPFADLRSSPTFLIGSFSNLWTSELSRNWRFQFRWTDQHYPVLADTQATPQREWSISAEDNGAASEDYSLICRLRNSPTGALLIVVAGIKQFGTEAGGRIIADGASLEPILARLPRGWEDRNLQIVLHSRVIGNTPAQPEFVAWHVW